jgi:acyl-coenzyme A thioesterase 13
MPSLDDPGLCPPGFKPLFRTSPFLDASGPFFHKPEESGFIVGLRVLDKHTNASGTAHGGLVATLADVSMGYVTAASKMPPLRMITASLGIDFVGTAQVGDWMESHVDVVKAGSRLAFVNARIAVDGACVASARAVFLVL